MPVANLANVPDSPETWNEYSFSLQATLVDINQRILQQYSVYLPNYILDPFNINDPGAQLFQLQEMMNNINGTLNLSGFDYKEVNLQNREQVASWVFLLFTNIKQAADKVGVG
ncbi:MAG: hypothetical protein KGL39_07565 [Patescibacteria group bacterium]|nr:hypothetical protein [Patescibacteria group bacterium]